MNILLVTPFYPPDIGGIAQHVYELTSILLHQKNSVAVITCAKTSQLTGIYPNMYVVPYLSPPPYPYHTLSSFRIPTKPLRIDSAIKAISPDIIHVHGHHYPITWLSTEFAKSRKIPVILTLHGLYALAPGAEPIEEIFNKTVFRWLLAKVDAIIGTTQVAIEYVKKYYPSLRVGHVIPYGLQDYRIFLENLNRKRDFRQKYMLPEEKVIVLYVGRFVHVKGISELTEACRRINSEKEYGDKVYFLFVGQGSLKKNINDRLKGYTNYRIIDWVSHEKLHEIYIASDIFILPSKWAESFGIVLIEAMAANLFILTTPVGGIPEVLAGYRKKAYIRAPLPLHIAEAIKEALKLYSEGNHAETSNKDILRR